MPIDSSIYQNIQVQPQYNALDQYAKRQQIESVVGQNELAKLMMGEKQREMSEAREIRDLTRSTGGDSNKLAQALFGAGQYKAGMNVNADIRKQQKDSSELAKTNTELASKRLDLYRSAIPEIRSPQDAVSWVTAQYNDPALKDIVSSMGTLESSISRIPQDAEGLARWQQQNALGMASYIEKNKPSYHTENLGSISQTTARPGLGGMPTIVSSNAINQSPDNAATNQRMQEEGSLNRSIQKRGQDLVNARAKDASGQGGKAPAGYRYLPNGDMEVIPGGPADIKAQAAASLKATGASDVDTAISALRSAYDRLEAGGGITSTSKGAISNAASAASSSGLGQVVGKTLGTQNQSARNDIAMTRPALLAALMKATGMSAKQMDSNAELKLWMTTATDPTLDVESNRRALDNIERKYMSQSAPIASKSMSPTKANAAKGGAKFLGFE